MHRGNPSLTGEVQASGLRHFQRVKWELEGQFAVHLPLVANSDLMYALWLTGMQTEIRAIEKETGMVRWQWKPNQHEYAGHAHLFLDQGILYYPVRSLQPDSNSFTATLKEAYVYAFDAQTGQLLRRIPVPAFWNRAIFSLFTIQEGVIYLYGMEGASVPGRDQYSCAAVDLQTEQLLWRADLGTRLLWSTSPVVAQGRVYLQTYDSPQGHQWLKHLHALNAHTGEPLWGYECPSSLVCEFAVAETDIFLLGHGLEVVDAVGGTRKWSWTSHGSRLNGPPTVTDEFIYLSAEGSRILIENEPGQVGEREIQTGEMVLLERATRRQLWVDRAREGQNATDGALVADEVLYAVWKELDVRPATVNATLFALDLHTGQEYWRFDAAELSTPLVTDGNVFVVRGQGEGMSTFLCALT